MIARIFHVARREWLEQLRQPAMMISVGSLFSMIAALYVTAVVLLELIRRTPEAQAGLMMWLPALGMGSGDGDPLVALGSLATIAVSLGSWLIFTQYLGITSVIAGHTVLHDRERGALPFLLLAPLRRTELLAGKVIGAIGPATLIYFVIAGSASVVAASTGVTAGASARLPPSPGFIIAFLLGGPTWAAAVGGVASVLSGVASDVRTAQQGVWLVMFFATFGCGYLVAGLMDRGAGVALAVAVLGALCAAAVLWVGGQVISRDLGR
jgi:ABC-type Na+ efflux pump permease subunit